MYISAGITPLVEKTREAGTDGNAIAYAGGVVTVTVESAQVGEFYIIEACPVPKLVDMVMKCETAGKLTAKVPGVLVSGGATATVAKITEWLEIPCPQEPQAEGGEQNYMEVRCNLGNPTERPTYKSAVRTGWTFAHELESDAADLLRAHEADGGNKAYRQYLPDGGVEFVTSGRYSFQDNPTIAQDAVVTQSFTVSLATQWNAYKFTGL